MVDRFRVCRFRLGFLVAVFFGPDLRLLPLADRDRVRRREAVFRVGM